MAVNRVRTRREELGLTQTGLAATIGVSRQTLNAVESGRAVPSVMIALRLARELASDVETLFAQAATIMLDARVAGTVPGPGARVLLGLVREHWIAHPLAAEHFAPSQYSADGFIRGFSGHGRSRIELTRSEADLKETVLIGGCAPGLSVLCDRLNAQRGPGRFRWLSQANMAALRGLSRGHTHVAGVHLPDEPRRPAAKTLARHLPTERASVFALAKWEAGLVVPAGNPHRIKGVARLADARVRTALREDGSGAREQLVRLLRQSGVGLEKLLPRALAATSHMAVAQAVRLGAADVGFAIRAAALALGLDFVPMVEERFDLVVPHDLIGDGRVLRMLDTLASASFRGELEELGYDPSVCAQKVAEIEAG
jgi:molybdate-binding protein/DNA-binding XRE family transcriptional regulator